MEQAGLARQGVTDINQSINPSIYLSCLNDKYLLQHIIFFTNSVSAGIYSKTVNNSDWPSLN